MAIIIYKLLLLSFYSNLNLMLGNHKIPSRVAFTSLILYEVVKKMQAVSESCSMETTKGHFPFIHNQVYSISIDYLPPNNHTIEMLGSILAISNR